MELITEDSWTRGWEPSSSLQGDFGAPAKILRMDNLTIEETGSIRLAKGAVPVSSAPFTNQVNSIFGVYANGKKYRYAYDSDGTLVRNYGTGAAEDTFDQAIFSGGTTKKAAFSNSLGHCIVCTGSKKYKDNLTSIFPLDIPTPASPVVASVGTTGVIDCSNLDGSFNYTNWLDLASSSFFDNTGTGIDIKALYGTPAFCYTEFASPLDTTDFGGTGKGTDADLLSFKLNVEDLNTFQWIQIVFSCDGTLGNNGSNYYTKQLFKAELPLDALGYALVQIPRGSFNRYGSDASKDWSGISEILISLSHFPQDADLTHFSKLSEFSFTGGIDTQVTGTNVQYVAVEVRDTGSYLQFSVNSVPSAVTQAKLNSLTITRATPVDSQCNQFWLFRRDDETGVYLLVHIETGALGFTPTTFVDSRSDIDLETDAASNSTYTLEAYRTALPNDIIGMLWFADRLIYLTEDAFIPSFRLDPGTYDSRFTYQLVGTTSETCLFIAKINVGMFLVATTKDFYQVTGTFTKVDLGNGVQSLDVTIRSLGCTDPAISRSFIEMEGSIIYLSSTGLRSLINSSSSIINGPLDLLFRAEDRYNINAVDLKPNDGTDFSCATNGNRLYFSLPNTDGFNRTFVLIMNSLIGTYWRYLTDAPKCMFREDDGNILFGGAAGSYIQSLDSATTTVPIYFKTQFSFGKSPESRKDAIDLVLFVNTHEANLTLAVSGYLENGSIDTASIILNSDGLIRFDIAKLLPPCLGYSIEIYGDTDGFELNYFILSYNNRPAISTRYLQLPTNFGKPNKKKLATWPFRADSLGNAITVVVKGDGVSINGSLSTSSSSDPTTFFWRNIQDIAAVDWEFLATAEEMEFYELHKPEITQIFPMGKLIDQLGPFDFKAQSLVYGMRLKVLNEGILLHYKIYDADSLVYEQDLDTLAGLDQSYLQIFPKGIDPAVLRIVLSSSTVFYRFSLELKIRKLGKDTEETYVSVG